MTGKQRYWLPEVENAGKPVYLEIADAIERDIESGELAVAARLPPQRYVADKLGVNLATVARAYTEAQQRGLIDSRVGQGTFVRRPSERRSAAAPRSLSRGDMLMNMPPEPDMPALSERMRAGIGALDDLPSLLRYQDFGGSAEARAAGARWLSPRLGDTPLDRLLVFPGAQAALLCSLSAFTQPGDAVCCEELTYPGFKGLAQQFGLRLVGLPLDEEGIDASVFEAACREATIKFLYTNPTLLNPTTTTISQKRREALVRVAKAQGVMILEDDAYGALPLEPPAAFARLAPDITFHVSSLAKCVGAGLRVAYVIVPEARHAARLLSALAMTSVFASPITTAIATRWIEEGVASAALQGIRNETRARQELVARTLPAGSYVSDPEAFHLWLRLPQGWNRHAFESHLRGLGVSVAVSDAFAVTSSPPEAVRICLGGPATRSDVLTSLAILADSLAPRPMLTSMVI